MRQRGPVKGRSPATSYNSQRLAADDRGVQTNAAPDMVGRLRLDLGIQCRVWITGLIAERKLLRPPGVFSWSERDRYGAHFDTTYPRAESNAARSR